MKTANAGTIALIAAAGGGTPYVEADLYTLTLVDGTVIRWSGEDVAVTIGLITWPLGPLIERGSIKEERGVAVSTLGVTITPRDADLILGVAMIPFVRAGGLDGATLQLDRGLGYSWTNFTGTVNRFLGRVGPARNITRDSFEIAVNASTELLNTNMPPNIVQPTCLHSLFDTGCALSRASFATAKTVGASPAPTTLAFNYSNTSPVRAAGYFDQGKVVFTSGANNGLSRTIRSMTSGGLITLVRSLPAAPAVGDGITLYPGCNKLQATCSGKFSNLTRFRGMPYVPVPETGI